MNIHGVCLSGSPPVVCIRRYKVARKTEKLRKLKIFGATLGRLGQKKQSTGKAPNQSLILGGPTGGLPYGLTSFGGGFVVDPNKLGVVG